MSTSILSRHPVLSSVALIWLTLVAVLESQYGLLLEYGRLFFLGVVGAIFANSTGAGGGVVFVPFFKQLGLESQVIIATSFGIQCCGMTAGALTWWFYYRGLHRHDPHWEGLLPSLKVTILPSLLGIWTVQCLGWMYPSFAAFGSNSENLHTGFGTFSIMLAIAIYGSIPLMNKRTYRTGLSRFDLMSLGVIAYLGGAITAWLSVGVGELVAVYLIVRRYNITMAIAVAVVLSAFSVWGSIVYHTMVQFNVEWRIVLFAGAGAIVGGRMAKHLVLAFSPSKLKVFFATWVLLLGVTSLPIF